MLLFLFRLNPSTEGMKVDAASGKVDSLKLLQIAKLLNIHPNQIMSYYQNKA